MLFPIRIFGKSFQGKTLYKNPEYITPTALRILAKRRMGSKYEERKGSQKRRAAHEDEFDGVVEDELGDVFQ